MSFELLTSCMCYCYHQKRGKEYLIVEEKNLGVRVLPERKFTEPQKTNEEKMQAPGGDTDPEYLAAGHPCGQGSRVPGNPWGVGEEVSIKDLSWVECS